MTQKIYKISAHALKSRQYFFFHEIPLKSLRILSQKCSLIFKKLFFRMRRKSEPVETLEVINQDRIFFGYSSSAFWKGCVSNEKVEIFRHVNNIRNKIMRKTNKNEQNQPPKGAHNHRGAQGSSHQHPPK